MSLRRELAEFDGPSLLQADVWRDHRGSFTETFSVDAFQAITGCNDNFRVDAHSTSINVNVVRGLHFQLPPKEKAKIVRVSRGKIQDVIVDIRTGSPTYGDHALVVLSARNGHQLFVPAGFAHGYRTLAKRTEVQYKATQFFDPNLAAGIRWDDPTLAIDWGIPSGSAILSDEDQALPAFASIEPRLAAAGLRWQPPLVEAGPANLDRSDPMDSVDFRPSAEILADEGTIELRAFHALGDLARALPPFRIVCLRHGETEDNARGVFSGQRDTMLSRTGISQAYAVSGLNLAPVGWIFASDLLRARQTAAIVVNRFRSRSRVYLDPRLREICLGVHEGQRELPVDQGYSIDSCFRGGESYSQLFFRICSFLHSFLKMKQRSGAEGDCLLIGHAGSWRMLRSLFQPTSNVDQLFENSLSNCGFEFHDSHALTIPEIWRSRMYLQEVG